VRHSDGTHKLTGGSLLSIERLPEPGRFKINGSDYPMNVDSLPESGSAAGPAGKLGLQRNFEGTATASTLRNGLLYEFHGMEDGLERSGLGYVAFVGDGDDLELEGASANWLVGERRVLLGRKPNQTGMRAKEELFDYLRERCPERLAFPSEQTPQSVRQARPPDSGPTLS
jgi:hypothetical protein